MLKQTQTVTQADIAAEAGVSQATVSRVLNNSPMVTDEARIRVEAAIGKFGYVRHGAARALASSRTQTIGAVIPTLNNAIFSAGINAFEEALQQADFTMLLAVSNYSQSSEVKQVRRLLERGVDGMLLIGNEHDEAVYSMLERAHVRWVNTWVHDEAAGLPNVGFSNRRAMMALVDHLVERGHRTFGMLAGLTAFNDRARERLDAARSRLAEHGLALDPAFTGEVDYSIRAARQRVAGMMASGAPLPSALMCGNDVIALGAAFELRDRGIAVPDTVAVTGFDDLPLLEHIKPAITTVAVPAEEMGRLAARKLLEALETGAPVESVELETRLVVRGSS